VKRLAAVLVALLVAVLSLAQPEDAPKKKTNPPAPSTQRASPRVHVRGYHRKDGTYVQPHTRSYPHKHGKSAPKKKH
jgi:hypothetical protein